MRRVACLLFLSVVTSVPLKNNGGDEKHPQPVPINPVDDVTGDGIDNGLLSGHLFKTVKRYHCSLSRNGEQAKVLLYGTNGWAFPKQDVNLTLSYPTANSDTQDYDDYLIVGYEIILFTDGFDSSGFVTAGGLLRDNITLNFIMSRITMLSYEFWLFGVPENQATNVKRNQMC